VTGCLSTALGDIDGLHRSAASLSEAAGALDQQRAALSGVLSGATTGAGAWTGEAARAFTSDALDTAGDLRHLAEACRTAGDILTRLARALGDILTEAQGLRLRALTAGIELTPDYHVAPVGPGDTFDFYKGVLAEELRGLFADLHERAARIRRAAAVELHGVLRRDGCRTPTSWPGPRKPRRSPAAAWPSTTRGSSGPGRRASRPRSSGPPGRRRRAPSGPAG
jgi:hypothetical protein